MSSSDGSSRGDAPVRMFTFASGGWVVALAGVISILLVLFWVVPIARHPRPAATGNGADVATYGFDLSTCLVPRAELIASGMPKDGLPALDEPGMMPASSLEAFNKAERDAHRSKYLVPDDRVIGVSIYGEQRAYPLRLLVWHEVVNDTVATHPIAVTYNALTDTAVVFSRIVGHEVVEFGVSGLLYNSAGLLYDRSKSAGKGESLWCPLQRRAVAGPAAASGQALTAIPAQLVRWATWVRHYPDTSVMRPDPRWALRYREEPYSSYFGSDALRFPVRPLPPGDGVPLKTPVVVLENDGARRVVSLAEAAAQAKGGVYAVAVGGRNVHLDIEGEPSPGHLSAFVESDDGGSPPVIAHTFRFAWFATGATQVPVRPNSMKHVRCTLDESQVPCPPSIELVYPNGRRTKLPVHDGGFEYPQSAALVWVGIHATVAGRDIGVEVLGDDASPDSWEFGVVTHHFSTELLRPDALQDAGIKKLKEIRYLRRRGVIALTYVPG